MDRHENTQARPLFSSPGVYAWDAGRLSARASPLQGTGLRASVQSSSSDCGAIAAQPTPVRCQSGREEGAWNLAG